MLEMIITIAKIIMYVYLIKTFISIKEFRLKYWLQNRKKYTYWLNTRETYTQHLHNEDAAFEKVKDLILTFENKLPTMELCDKHYKEFQNILKAYKNLNKNDYDFKMQCFKIINGLAMLNLMIALAVSQQAENIETLEFEEPIREAAFGVQNIIYRVKGN